MELLTIGLICIFIALCIITIKTLSRRINNEYFTNKSPVIDEFLAISARLSKQAEQIDKAIAASNADAAQEQTLKTMAKDFQKLPIYDYKRCSETLKNSVNPTNNEINTIIGTPAEYYNLQSVMLFLTATEANKMNGASTPPTMNKAEAFHDTPPIPPDCCTAAAAKQILTEELEKRIQPALFYLKSDVSTKVLEYIDSTFESVNAIKKTADKGGFQEVATDYLPNAGS